MNKYLIAVILCFILQSCFSDHNRPISQLEDLTEDIREHHEEYSAADWKESYAEYKRIAAEMERYQYTKEEAEKIGKLEGECLGYFMKSAVNSFEIIGSELEGFFEGLNNSFQVKGEE